MKVRSWVKRNKQNLKFFVMLTKFVPWFCLQIIYCCIKINTFQTKCLLTTKINIFIMFDYVINGKNQDLNEALTNIYLCPLNYVDGKYFWTSRASSVKNVLYNSNNRFTVYIYMLILVLTTFCLFEDSKSTSASSLQCNQGNLINSKH